MNLYGIYKRNTIENTCLMNAYLDDTREYCHNHNLMYVTCADVPGYMNEGCSTLHAYNGKYGKGVVRTRPSFYKGRRSTNYMTIEYWVTRDDIHRRLTGESEVQKMCNSGFFLVEYYDKYLNKLRYIKILACDEEHARHDFNVMFKGKNYVITGIERFTESEVTR